LQMSPFQRIVDLADGQWGLITRAQALGAGVPRSTFARMIDRGLLERVAHGTYRVRGAGETGHMQLRAAWLQLDPIRPAWERLNDPDVAVISHTSAASLYGVGDLSPDIHEFTALHRWQTRRRDVRVHRGTVPSSDRIVLKGLPATRAGRTIADLLADHVEPTAVARITAEVIENVYDYPRVVAEKIAPFAASFGLTQRDGVALLEHLLDVAGGRLDRKTSQGEARK
jgi:predicted transcriptional regulator of viral defense system